MGSAFAQSSRPSALSLAVESATNAGNAQTEYDIGAFRIGVVDANTDYTAAIQAAADAAADAGGGVLVGKKLPTGSYYRITSAIKVASGTTVRIKGQVRQTTLGANAFEATGADRIRFEGCDIAGVAPQADPATILSQSVNNGIYLVSCTNVYVEDNVFSDLRYAPVYAVGCGGFFYRRNTEKNCAYSVRLRGVTIFDVSGNCATGGALGPTTFVTGIYCDSIAGHSFGYCAAGSIAKNKMSGWTNAQCIKLHAGDGVTIEGNVLVDAFTGVSVTPFTSGDVTQNIAIVGNVYRGTNTPGATVGTGNYGFQVNGGAGLPVSAITCVGNTATNANKIGKDTATLDTGAGFMFAYVSALTLSANVASGCYGSGFMFANAVTGVSGHGNTALSVQSANGRCAGILITASGCSGRLLGTTVDGAERGVHYDAAAPGLGIHDNTWLNLSGGPSANAERGCIDRCMLASQGETTVDVSGGAASIIFSNSVATAIADFPGGVSGQVLDITSTNGNTTITRGNARLAGGNDFTLAATNLLRLKNVGGAWWEIGRFTTAIS